MDHLLSPPPTARRPRRANANAETARWWVADGDGGQLEPLLYQIVIKAIIIASTGLLSQLLLPGRRLAAKQVLPSAVRRSRHACLFVLFSFWTKAGCCWVGRGSGCRCCCYSSGALSPCPTSPSCQVFRDGHRWR